MICSNISKYINNNKQVVTCQAHIWTGRFRMHPHKWERNISTHLHLPTNDTPPTLQTPRFRGTRHPWTGYQSSPSLDVSPWRNRRYLEITFSSSTFALIYIYIYIAYTFHQIKFQSEFQTGSNVFKSHHYQRNRYTIFQIQLVNLWHSNSKWHQISYNRLVVNITPSPGNHPTSRWQFPSPNSFGREPCRPPGRTDPTRSLR